MEEKIRIKLKAFDQRLLDKSVASIIETVKRAGSEISGPVLLPTKITRFTVLRSPHVNKKSREQFEIRTHKRLVEIYKLNQSTKDALMKLDLPAGVHVEVK